MQCWDEQNSSLSVLIWSMQLPFELWALRQTLINANVLTWGDWKPRHMRNCWNSWRIFVWKWLSMMIIFQYKENNLTYSLLSQEVELTNEYEPKPLCPIQQGQEVSLLYGFQISPLYVQIFSFSLAEVMVSSIYLAAWSFNLNRLLFKHTWPRVSNSSSNHLISNSIWTKSESEYFLSFKLFLSISHFYFSKYIIVFLLSYLMVQL